MKKVELNKAEADHLFEKGFAQRVRPLDPQPSIHPIGPVGTECGIRAQTMNQGPVSWWTHYDPDYNSVVLTHTEIRETADMGWCRFDELVLKTGETEEEKMTTCKLPDSYYCQHGCRQCIFCEEKKWFGTRLFSFLFCSFDHKFGPHPTRLPAAIKDKAAWYEARRIHPRGICGNFKGVREEGKLIQGDYYRESSCSRC